MTTCAGAGSNGCAGCNWRHWHVGHLQPQDLYGPTGPFFLGVNLPQNLRGADTSSSRDNRCSLLVANFNTSQNRSQLG